MVVQHWIGAGGQVLLKTVDASGVYSESRASYISAYGITI